MNQSRRAFVRASAAFVAGISLGIPSSRWRFASADGPMMRILASTPIFADIAQNIAGDRAEVRSIMPDNADPHTWEASAADLARVSESDAFIYMGAHLEPFIEAGAWRRAVSDAGIPVLELAEHMELVEVDKIIDHGDHVHDLREGDPHVWLDPLKVVEMTTAIEAFLTELDPEGVDTYIANAGAYRAELESLHDEIETGLAVIPPERRKLVVFHDAFTYFAARYDFEVIGIVLKSPDGEPSAQEFVELIELIQDQDIPVIFAEPQFDTGLLDGIVAETGVAIGELLTDSFAGRVDSYVALMRYDLESLVTHLGSD